MPKATSFLPSEKVGKLLTRETACPSLSFKSRIYGFVISFLLGIVISIISFIAFFFHKITVIIFAVLYAFSNMCAISSSCFFYGPRSQCKSMFKRKRLFISIMMVSLIAGTIVFAFFYKEEVKWHLIVMIDLIIGQFCFVFWYTLTYIPCGERLFKCFCTKFCCSD